MKQQVQERVREQAHDGVGDVGHEAAEQAATPTPEASPAPAPAGPAPRPDTLRLSLASQVRRMTAVLPQSWQSGSSLRSLLQSVLQQAQSLVTSVAPQAAALPPSPDGGEAPSPATVIEVTVVQETAQATVAAAADAAPPPPPVAPPELAKPFDPVADAADPPKVPWEIPPRQPRGSGGGLQDRQGGGQEGQPGSGDEGSAAAAKRRVRTLVESVQRAIDRLPAFDTLEDVVAAVHAHLRAHGSRPRLVVVGVHDARPPSFSPTATSVAMAVLRTYASAPLRKTLAMHVPAHPEVVRLAKASGFDLLRLDGDPSRTSGELEVAIAGARQVCTLFGPRLQPRDALAIAIVGRIDADDQRAAQQIGELLAEPRVLKIRPSWALESGALVEARALAG